eukprot:CAMPEP_0197526434 /NCGR_PEP_ID=MMETSP1318-20131121/17832_1 /TAXON_ID=552666 /ORGANISM="Partenskyella glossopodia, Strain RCC365" /LENGTH=262 /DNA_ID=CAMNT_0043080597 /DNA_START=14 /DNA_END=802 /DNA_ORIENTATION=-
MLRHHTRRKTQTKTTSRLSFAAGLALVVGAAVTLGGMHASASETHSTIGSSPSVTRRGVVAGLPFAAVACAMARNGAKAADVVTASTFDKVSVFGRLADSGCYGNVAKHASCTIDQKSVSLKLFGNDIKNAKLSKDELKEKLNQMPFEWPLKPFGVSADQKQKTVTLNKPAELTEWKYAATRKNMGNSFYLNGSDRDKLNRALESENVSDDAVEVLFKLLSSDGKIVKAGDIKKVSGMDWYDFTDMVAVKVEKKKIDKKKKK